MFENSLKQILKWTLICLLSFTSFNLLISGKIEASIEIEVSTDIVYEKVANLQTWQNWWEKDSTMTIVYSGEKSGLGSKISWTGIDGSGILEIVEANFSKDLKSELTFEGMTPSYSTWTFEKTDIGTGVTYSFDEELPFYVRFMQLFISNKLKDRLVRLKKLCES